MAVPFGDGAKATVEKVRLLKFHVLVSHFSPVAGTEKVRNGPLARVAELVKSFEPHRKPSKVLTTSATH